MAAFDKLRLSRSLSLSKAHAQNLTIFLNVPQLFDTKAIEYITQFVTDYRAARGDALDLLVIDTLHTATLGSNENDTRDANQVIAATRIARDALGCAVEFAHHANKATAGYRGSSAYAAAADCMLEVTGKKNPRKLSCFKLKDAAKFDPLEFLLEADGDLVHTYWNGPAIENDTNRADELLAEMQAQPDAWLSAAAWGETIGVTRNHATELLKELANRKTVKRTLADQGKKISKNNPWVYGVTDDF
jgi:hypothetical protein